MLFVTFVQTTTAYYIFTGNMSYYGGGLLSPNHYTTAFSPMSIMNGTNTTVSIKTRNAGRDFNLN